MSAELILALAGVVGVLLTGGGLYMTWRKSGREQKDRDERLAQERAAHDQAIQSNQQNILNKLDDKSTGLTAINEKINQVKEHCAATTAGFGERIIAAERDIKELKAK
jgi:uncharacterized protein HemX